MQSFGVKEEDIYKADYFSKTGRICSYLESLSFPSPPAIGVHHIKLFGASVCTIDSVLSISVHPWAIYGTIWHNSKQAYALTDCAQET